jgi:hypothetical protein
MVTSLGRADCVSPGTVSLEQGAWAKTLLAHKMGLKNVQAFSIRSPRSLVKVLIRFRRGGMVYQIMGFMGWIQKDSSPWSLKEAGRDEISISILVWCDIGKKRELQFVPALELAFHWIVEGINAVHRAYIMGSSKVTGCARCYSVFLIRSSGQPENVIPRGSRRATNVNCGRSFPESPMVGPLLQRERLFCGVLTGYDRSGTSRMWKATREHFLPSQFYVEPFTCVKILLRDCSFRPSAAKTKRWRQTMVVLAEIRHDYEFSWDCKAETPFSDSGTGNFMIRVNRCHEWGILGAIAGTTIITLKTWDL